jgi:hypothetical protein
LCLLGGNFRNKAFPVAEISESQRREHESFLQWRAAVKRLCVS